MTRTNFAGVEVTVVTDPTRDDLLTKFGKSTLDTRYLMPGEGYQDLFARVAGYYGDDDAHAQRLYDYMSRHWFMPSTPVLSNGGTNRGLPISCFLNAVPDSMQGIRDVWSENVDLASNGGGIGTYWGGVRSIDEKIKGRGETSGAIPFIKVQDSLTLAVSQGSLRRGSAAVYMDIHHPEIEEFTDIRRATGDQNRRCLNIHHGINITDKFMEAVKAGTEFDLISPKDGSVRKTVDARTLWQKILLARLETGEPYMVFIDTVNRNRPEVYKLNGLSVRQSNLCSEIALHTGIDYAGKVRTAVCCLSSLNWFTVDEWFGNELFLKDVACFLDNVMTDFIAKTENMPGFTNARYSAHMERSIGIGVMGFHSYLQRRGVPYEGAMAKAINMRMFKWLARTGAKINEQVALERGACPDAKNVGLWLRWSHMFSVAPTASISIIAGTTSAGIDPIPANLYTAKTLSGSFEVKNAQLDEVLREYAASRIDSQGFLDAAWKAIKNAEGSVQGLDFLSQDDKDTFKTFLEIDQRWVLEHAADRSPYIDQMASNNISVRADVHKRDLHNLHMKAWSSGVSSLYYLRSKSLQRGAKTDHIAGELPQPGPRHEIVLQDRGIAPEPLADIAYDECLACQ
jgi:ribonucleoside-diphosphate reductase alpha chain